MHFLHAPLSWYCLKSHACMVIGQTSILYTKKAFQSCLSGTTVWSSYWRSILVFTKNSQNIPTTKGASWGLFDFLKAIGAPMSCYANWRNISWKCRFRKIYRSHSIVREWLLLFNWKHSWSYPLYLLDILLNVHSTKTNLNSYIGCLPHLSLSFPFCLTICFHYKE